VSRLDAMCAPPKNLLKPGARWYGARRPPYGPSGMCSCCFIFFGFRGRVFHGSYVSVEGEGFGTARSLCRSIRGSVSPWGGGVAGPAEAPAPSGAGRYSCCVLLGWSHGT